MAYKQSLSLRDVCKSLVSIRNSVFLLSVYALIILEIPLEWLHFYYSFSSKTNQFHFKYELLK